MSFLGYGQDQARKPLAEVLPDGRKRLTRYFKVSSTGTIPASLNYPVKTPDPWSNGTDGAPAGWTGLLLTYTTFKDSERGFPDKAEDDKPIVQLVFEQISSTGETETGGEDPQQLDDGRKEVVFTYVMFTTSTYTPQTVGSSTAPSPYTSYYLLSEEADNDGTLRKIKRTYQTAGTIATDDESLHGGKLLKKVITSAFTVPSTPSGFTLVGSPVQHPSGYPIYDYTYYSGSPTAGAGGEISRRYIDSSGGTVAFSFSSPAVSIGAVRCIITYLTADSTTTDPTTGPGSFVKIGAEYESRDGYKVWTVTYAYGSGLVAEYISTRQDGLREVTDISLGSKVTPSGVVIRDDYKNEDGYIIYTVTSMQTDTGGSTVTSATMTFERYVPFVYPGRAKPYTETLGAVTALNVFLSPPVETLVKASVNITYGTTSALGTISDIWNPSSWATERSTWVGAYGRAASRTISHTGYRSTTTTSVTLTGSGYNATIYGYNIYASTTATLYVTGGPADPGGSTWTLSAGIEPAFTDTSGVRYFRKTLVSAAIPAQSSLPV